MISICLIMKNEATRLESCLQPLLPLGYEILIADTGSSDESKKIAYRYTDKVYDYQWNNDFAAARNFIADKATNEFVLFIDADEIITEVKKELLEKLVNLRIGGIGSVIRINNFTRGAEQYSGRERVSRLFSKKTYQYEGIIHEQVVSIRAKSNIYYNVPIVMHHVGYEGDVITRRKKTSRNIKLLKIQLEKKPEDPYVLYQLGKSYYMQKDYIKACKWFEKALSIDVNERLEYIQDLVETYGYALLEAKRYDTALQLLNIYDVFAKTADFVFLVGLIYMNNAYFKEAIEEFKKAVNMNHNNMDGVNSYRAFYNIGVIYECLGQMKKAKEYYRRCGKYEPALARLRDMS